MSQNTQDVQYNQPSQPINKFKETSQNNTQFSLMDKL